jgi:hypothetical protein
MGDRTTTYLPCPECGKESEQYDAPSCLIWSWDCWHCGWKDNRRYYEAPNNQIWLISEKDARGKELIMDCPKCKEKETWWENRDYGMCIECWQEEGHKPSDRKSRNNKNKLKNKIYGRSKNTRTKSNY